MHINKTDMKAHCIEGGMKLHLLRYVLVEAKNKQSAIQKVCTFAQSADFPYIDYMDVDERYVCALSEMKEGVVHSWRIIDIQAIACSLLAAAQQEVTDKRPLLAGSYARKAAALLHGEFTTEIPYYNLSDYSYRFPDNPHSYYAVGIDCHE